MFARKKPLTPPLENARTLYQNLLRHVRNPEFFTRYGVPDTFDGRFDLLLLHLFIVMHDQITRAPDTCAGFNQILFDATFADMDQTLREMGIGDMGIPKHMRRMMMAFNGRMQAYTDSITSGTLESTLKKNLYGTTPTTEPAILTSMANYIVKSLATLAQQDIQTIRTGTLTLPEPQSL